MPNENQEPNVPMTIDKTNESVIAKDTEYVIAKDTKYAIAKDTEYVIAKETEKKAQIPHLTYPDLLRVVGCLIVFSYHFAFSFQQYGITANVDWLYNWNGFTLVSPAVKSFIMVSGAVLMLRYGDGEFHPGQYYKKRFQGYFPYFWVDYCVAAMIDFWIRGHAIIAPKITLILTFLGLDTYFMIQGVTNFGLIGEWFSGILLIMYLLFPLVLWAGRKKIWLPNVILILGALLIVLFNPLNEILNTSVIINLMYFSIGMTVQKLTSIGMQKEKDGTLKNGRVSMIKHILGAVSFLILLPEFFTNFFRQLLPARIPEFLHVLAFYFLMIEIGSLLDLYAENRIVTIIRRILRFGGKYTLQIYLIHHVCIYWYISHFANTIQNNSSVLMMYLTLIAIILTASILMDRLTKLIISTIKRVVNDSK